MKPGRIEGAVEEKEAEGEGELGNFLEFEKLKERGPHAATTSNSG